MWQRKRAETTLRETKAFHHIFGGIAISFFIAPFALAQEDPVPPSIHYLETQHILEKSEDYNEPSGLALASDGKHFWTVSDNTDALYLLGLDGDLKPSHTIHLGVSGLEGIASDEPRGRLIAIAEDSAEVIEVLIKTGEIHRFRLADMQGYDKISTAFETSDPNNGLEGITVNPASGAVFLLKENQPRMMIELSPDLTSIRGALELTAKLGFVSDRVFDTELDVAGLDYDPDRNAFWIVSDTGECLYLFDPLKGKAHAWPLLHANGRVKNAEGVALADGGTRLMVVTDDDKGSRMYSYEVK